MITISATSKPFSNKNESGDFYQYIELEDYFLLAVGDIGGHGSNRVYTLASKIQNIIELNKEKPLSKIITTIHEQEMLHNNGMTLFLAQVYKNMPMINYSAVGNTKATILRKNNFVPLHIQEGILGYNIPTSIKTHMTKVSDGDILLVHTDGISLHKEQFMSTFSNTKNIDSITQYCVENFGNDDDRLCVALRFEIVNNKYFSLKYDENSDTDTTLSTNKKSPIPKISNDISNKSHTKPQSFSKNDVGYPNNSYQQLNNNNKIVLLDSKKLLINNISQSSVQSAISKISKLAQLDKMTETKIKTFLYEITKSSNVDLYLDRSLLQIFINDIKHFKESLEFLFSHFYISKQKEVIINITLPYFISFSDEKFNTLKEMFALGLNDSEYERFKENERQMQKMSGQARLSAMGEMIGNIAHQWRQPLSVISTSATSLALKKEFGMLTDEMLFKACDTINESAQYLSTTIDDFRDFIQGETYEEEFELQSFFSKTLNIVQASIKDNYVNLDILPYENIKMFGALNLLIQVVVNIINNAKDILVEKFVEEKLIVIEVSHTNEKVIIKITDNGGGVPKEIKDKIFDAYFTTKHQSKGTGLGLNMAFNIIMNSFNGTLEVVNETFSHSNIEYFGASFIITIPFKKK
jgi:signal transduction histidine kinase